ncbi:unnamed protein product, partial [Effrenium voratum]
MVSGPQGADVTAACVPFSDHELQLHDRYIRREMGLGDRAGLNPTDTVLWSKVIAAVRMPQVLDSIHHGTWVEVWALTQAFNFDCLIWSSGENDNVWVRSMEYMNVAHAEQKLEASQNVLELVHRDMGITGHYDLMCPEKPNPSAASPSSPSNPAVPAAASAPAGTTAAAETDENHAWGSSEPQTGEPVASEDEVGDVDVESVQSWDSDASVSTNEADIPVTVEPNMTWCTPEDKEEQEAALLAKALRPHPLLPPQLPGWEGVEPDQIPTRYVAALLQCEDKAADCGALICACCARVHATGDGGEVGYVQAQQLFESLSPESFEANWCNETYQQRYGSQPAVQQRLVASEWARTLPHTICDGKSILCCPEDLRCTRCPHSRVGAGNRGAGSNTLCEACEVPLCRACLVRMQQKEHWAVPQALTNNNWHGYPLELLYTEKVRWIEAAVACPVWTSVVAYHLEADRGHLLEEQLHRAEHRSAIRGNVSSFSLPWEEVLKTLDPKSPARKLWGALPHGPDVARSLIKVTVKGMRRNEAIQWVAGAKIRPWVVVQLLQHSIDIEHPMCEAAESVEAAKQTAAARVTAVYGTEETEPLVETEAVAQAPVADAACETTSGHPSKHATPETGATASLTGEAFGGNTRPNVASPDYNTSQFRDPDLDLVGQLATTTNQMTLDTEHTFWDQWKNDFLHWAYPFSLPAPLGGPDFLQKPRPRRTAAAPQFAPLTHLKYLAGRVESSIRNSWDLVPGLRRITFKWQSVWGGSLWRRWQGNRQKLAAVPKSDWIQAAQGLYQKLQSGTYLSADGRSRPIQYDTRKLHYAKGLTAEESQLLQDVRAMQATMPGTIEVRRRIGRFLFGARVELGEPLFVTISPTTRHNSLCIRFSRYRRTDPGSGSCSGRNVPQVWETGFTELGVPPYDDRREQTARDPWAVVLSFQTIVRCVFAKLLGIRMCFRCPDCDCRDAAGHGCHPTGGVLALGRREDAWLSGTMNAFSLLLFGNSHTSLNFRVPLTPETHDPQCVRGCLDRQTLPKLQRAMAQAARRSTRYFTGYLQKPQPVGRKELQQAAKQLHFLGAAPAAHADVRHYHQVVRRVFGDLEFRCSVRPMTEEFMLAGFGDSSEPSSAECIRTFPVVPFVGVDWLRVLDAGNQHRHKVEGSEPRRNAAFKHSEVYGWRGVDSRVYYLSPWEFVKLWTVRKLQPPPEAPNVKRPTMSQCVDGAQPPHKPPGGWKYGRDFVWKKKLPAQVESDIVRFPRTVARIAAEDHYLQRRTEPAIPFPTICPLPKPDMSKEAHARLLNVYLRPWTLELTHASKHVPHIAALGQEWNVVEGLDELPPAASTPAAHRAADPLKPEPVQWTYGNLTQAALIQGMTLHSFAKICVKARGADASQTSSPDAFAQYQRLRWVIIDECSTVGVEVL